jgi:hypothetical protein
MLWDTRDFFAAMKSAALGMTNFNLLDIFHGHQRTVVSA